MLSARKEAFAADERGTSPHPMDHITLLQMLPSRFRLKGGDQCSGPTIEHLARTATTPLFSACSRGASDSAPRDASPDRLFTHAPILRKSQLTTLSGEIRSQA